MSKVTAPSFDGTEPTRDPPRGGRLGRWPVGLGALVAALVFAWIGQQRGLGGEVPAAYGAMVYLLLTCLLPVGAVLVAGWGIGWWFLRWATPGLERPGALRLAAGLGLLLWGHLVVGSLGGLGAVAAWALLGAGGLGAALAVMVERGGPIRPFASLRVRLPADATPARRGWPVAAVLVGPAAGLLAVAATVPPGTLWRVEALGYDVLSYHLQLPREWVAMGRIAGLEHNVYSFLPSLMESAYAMLMAGPWGQSWALPIYQAQLLHAALAVAAAGVWWRAASPHVPRALAPLAGAVLLSVPWVLVTGSLAYNEAAVLLLGGAAMTLAMDPSGRSLRGAAAVGMLCGLATLAKATAGVMIAIPVGLLLLTRLNHTLRWQARPSARRAAACAAVAGLAGLITLSPYLVRNAVATGNPVFPFATSVFGSGHWDEQLVERWDAAHTRPAESQEGLGEAVWRQALGNAGYGAVGGATPPVERANVARFGREGGVPVLWVATVVGAGLALSRRGTRRPAAAMLVVLGVQVGFWAWGTHWQSRFLIPTLLPVSMLVVLGLGRLAAISRAGLIAGAVAGAGLVTVLVAQQLDLLWGQTPRMTGPGELAGRPAPVAMLTDGLPVTASGPDPLGLLDHPVNDLPSDAVVMIVADNTRLLYLLPGLDYHTAFDPSPLGELMRTHPGDSAGIAEGLRRRGATHLWVGWSELDRLHGTYGFDPAVTREALGDLTADWPAPTQHPTGTLWRVPTR